MCTLYNKNYITAIPAYLDTYLKNKPADCILYSEDGTEFKIRKELLSQTKFLRKILSSAKDHCCDIIEILCPCSKEELGRLVEFLYKGKIICDRKNGSFHILENLIKIFGFPANIGFPENFSSEDESETLISDYFLSTSIEFEEFTIKEEPIENTLNDSNINVLANNSKIHDEKLNRASQNNCKEQSELEDETSENVNDSNSNRITKIRFKASDNKSVKKKRISRKMESSDFALEQKNKVIQQIKARHHCNTCGKDFSKKNNLDRHNRTAHLNEIFVCSGCAETFSTKIARDCHYNNKHDPNPKFYTCPYCKLKKWKISGMLRTHVLYYCAKNPDQQKNRAKAKLSENIYQKRKKSDETLL